MRDASSLFPDQPTYFLTLVVRNKLPIFRIDRAARLMLSVLQPLESRKVCFVIGYVVMPDHVHLLVSLRDNRNPAGLTESLKSDFVTRLMKDEELLKHPLVCQLTMKGLPRIWAAPTDEVEIGNQSMLCRCLHFIHFSPVARGLANEPAEYEYSSARWYF